ncbi:cholinesterase 1-like [Ixodes scapularis]|uniref:cholinesterase 1-like n=1 Tax=Ixodes scapularis TaxID=6945 RepID=UPI001A9EBC4B|nr:cholinesterase 1-like [Ixodes scapularis]
MIPTESSEDCLHLNIWTPVVRPFCAFDCNPRTVILFFYGRDFEHGCNNLDLYDGRALSARGDVLVVVPNYRLGVFGFLNAHMPDAPGNVGLLDMLLALKWVQENIDAFAGDPRNIVLFGHDTGATSLGYFLLHPGLLKAHRRLILHSGSPLRPLRDNTAGALANLRALASSASCPAAAGDPGGSVDCLRNLTVPELQRASDRLRIALGPRFVPSFDSFPMMESPFGVARSKLFEDKQVLVASVVDEGAFEIGVVERTYLWDLADNQTAMAIGLMAALELYLNERDPANNCSDYLRKFAEELEHKSLKSKQLVRSAWRDFLGKFFFDCPLEYWAQNLTSASKLHLFRFRHRPRRNTEKVTARNDDLELVFGRPLITGVTGTMSNLSKKVIDFWSYFARTGSLPAVSKAVQWPQFRSESPARIEVFDTGFVTYRAGVSESCTQLMPLIYPRVHGWDTKTAARPGTFTFLGERKGR